MTKIHEFLNALYEKTNEDKIIWKYNSKTFTYDATIGKYDLVFAGDAEYEKMLSNCHKPLKSKITKFASRKAKYDYHNMNITLTVDDNIVPQSPQTKELFDRLYHTLCDKYNDNLILIFKKILDALDNIK